MANESLGVYISVPFCKAKCSYCNFASGVFAPERMERYVERLSAEIAGARTLAAGLPADLPTEVDSIYLGGGTPSLLSNEQTRRIFTALRNEFVVAPDAEVTVECAPGQLNDQTLDELLRQGMNRVSLGVQSFVDAEARAVGRLHTRASCLAEIIRLRAAGVNEINIDLIVGLPRQTRQSLGESIDVALASNVPHLSLYMLEIDEDSRLGRELLAHGDRYGASTIASEDETAEWTSEACERLAAGGVHQYEISNFACAPSGCTDHRSRHNVKYWYRDPYLGFGLDAHSMLRRTGCSSEALRWANADDLDAYMEQGELAGVPKVEQVTRERAFEETIFLGLRMNEGLDLNWLRAEFGEPLLQGVQSALVEVEEAGLLVREGSRIRLTACGRLASNEVFSRLLVN
jgi:oxygen-independent coproporphyrinogen-3 oxidase